MNLLNVEDSKRRVAVYIRVSTQEQNIDGYGLEAQKSKLLTYVNENKALNLTTKPEWLFQDVHTGSDLSRTELDRLRQSVKKKEFDAIIVWKIDRLSRSLKHLLVLFEEFEENNVSFISVQENIDFKGPIGKLIFQIFGAIAQFERELIKGRTHMGKVASAEMGNFIGSSIPYGYRPVKNEGRKGKKIFLIPEEKEWVQKIYEWYIYEDLGFGAIADRLNEFQVQKGKYAIKSNKYTKWTEKSVKPIIKRSLYRGAHIASKKDEYGKELSEDKWTIVTVPPCVTEFTFQLAQRKLTEKKGGWSKNDYILSGKLKDVSNIKTRSFTGCKRSDDKLAYRRKKFTDSDGTVHPTFEFPAEQLEDYVIERIKEAFREPEIFIQRFLADKYKDKTRIKKIELELSHLRAAESDLEFAIDRIEAAHDKGVYSLEKMNRKTSASNAKIAKIQTTIKELEDELKILGTIDVEIQKLKSAAEQVQYKFEKLTRDQKKILVGLFVDRIEMNRVMVDERWKITADIFFRFTPTSIKESEDRVRTRKAQQKNKKPDLNPENDVSGDRGGI